MFVSLNVTFFENQSYYAHIHHQGENSSEALFWETIPLPVSSFESMPSIPVQSLVFSPIPSSPSSPMSSPLSKMPTQQLREEDLPQPKLHVYSKRTNLRRIEPSVHCQEPELISIDLESIGNSYSSPSVDDLDLPIALRK